MIKQQIIMDSEKIVKDGKYDSSKIQAYVDNFMTSKIGFIKKPDGFYVGSGTKEDFARAGFAMTSLRQKPWFMQYVKTWLHFNSDDSDDPNDFAIEDFKEYNLNKLGLSA
jgi:virulence-associated protein VapD